MKYIVRDGGWQAWDETVKPIPEELLPFVQDSPPELTPEQETEMRDAKANAEIMGKLPELLRIIANDDLKGFDNLKAEIKAIDQSVITKEIQNGRE